MGMPDPFAALARACASDGAGSSDFDLVPDLRPKGAKLRPAGVLVPVIDGAGGPRVILTQRSSVLKHHPGQIAFPGGKVDAGDADETAAALREAQEEIGLDPANVEVIGTLPRHETITAFRVTPVVARVKAPFTPIPEPGEVAEVFSVPLAHVTDPDKFIIEGRFFRGQYRPFYTVPWGPYYIWGATARMLRVLADRVSS